LKKNFYDLGPGVVHHQLSVMACTHDLVDHQAGRSKGIDRDRG
jgi:hypothetical protein